MVLLFCRCLLICRLCCSVGVVWCRWVICCSGLKIGFCGVVFICVWLKYVWLLVCLVWLCMKLVFEL